MRAKGLAPKSELDQPRSRRPRARHGVAVLATSAATLTAFGGVAAASGGGSSGSSNPMGTLQAEAAQLSNQIQATGVQIDKLSEAIDLGQEKQKQLNGEIAASQAAINNTAAQEGALAQSLRQDAVASYMSANNQASTATIGLDNQPGVATAYTQYLANSDQQKLSALAQLKSQQQAQQGTLARQQQAVKTVLSTLKDDEHKAAAAQAAMRHALDQVKGQMAQLVAQYQAQQEAAMQARLQAQQQQAAEQQAARQQAAQQQYARQQYAQQQYARQQYARQQYAQQARGQRGQQTQQVPARGAAPQRPGQPQRSLWQPAPATQQGTFRTPSAPAAAPTSTAHGAAPAARPTYTAPASRPAVAAPKAVPLPPKPPAGSSPQVMANWERAIAFARSAEGTPYLWGGEGANGYDCSGLVQAAYGHMGINLPRTAQQQWDATSRVPINQLAPGNLVFWGTPTNVYHVGIYVGNGRMIVAPTTGQTVQEQSIYWGDLLGGGRVG